MKIIYVAGGKYKSFYLNKFLKLKECDLLIFNFNIFYPYIVKEELLGDAILTKEILFLSRSLNCTLVAGVEVVYQNKNRLGILVCDNDKIYISMLDEGAKVIVKDYTFRIGGAKTKYGKDNIIILSRRRMYPNLYNCSRNKIYLFCDPYGVDIVKNKKLERKFHKYSKIILK